MRIGHAHLKVRDSQVSAAFYERVLGLTIRERVGRHFIFMSGTEVHHEIALQEVGAVAASPGRWDVGLFHVAFEVPNKGALARCYQILVSLKIPVVMVDHRISWALYFSDPDGNGLEVYCDTRSDSDGVELWEGVDRPLSHERLLAELNP